MVNLKKALGIKLIVTCVMGGIIWSLPEVVCSEDLPIQLEIKNSEDNLNLRIIKDEDDLTVSKVYKFQNIPAEELVDFISSSLSDNGSLAVLKDQNAVLITDLPSKVDSIIKALKELDTQKTSGDDGIKNYFYRFQNINITSVIPFLKQRLTDKGKITYDETLNTIMISDIPSRLAESKEIINNVDILSDQVEIEITVMEVGYEKGQKVGLDWNHIFESLEATPKYQYSERKEKGMEEAFRQYFDIAISGPISLSEFLNLLVSSGSAKIKTTPRISILNNQTGRLEFVDKIYYLSDNRETSKDIGLTLKISPQITATGLIKLAVDTGYSTLNGFTNQNQPIITSRETSTAVILKDGQSFFISGLIKEDKVITEKKVPILGSIPPIAYFFKRKISQDKVTEIVITLTPKIIRFGTAPK